MFFCFINAVVRGLRLSRGERIGLRAIPNLPGKAESFPLPIFFFQTTHVHNHSDTRGARQLTLVLYSMLLKYIRSEPLAKKYFPLQTHSENLTSWDLPRTLPASHYSWIPVCFRMSAWLYSEYPGDRKMCDVIEEIFSLTEQIHPIFLIDVVKFLLNVCCLLRLN